MVEDERLLNLMQFDEADLLLEVPWQAEAREQLAVFLREQGFLFFSPGSEGRSWFRRIARPIHDY